MKLFDLHCDTAYEIFKEKTSLYENTHDISVSRAEKAFESYAQVMAIWTRYGKSDEECFSDFLSMRDNLVYEAEKCGARICLSGKDAETAWNDKKTALFIGVEGARILAGKTERIKKIYDLGVRFLTLGWKGNDIIGGSHNTDLPITDFGRETVRECMHLGIIVDLSHASREVTRECIGISKELCVPVIATHSNAFSLNPHTRNLTDEEAKAIADCGGIIGISLAPEHLCESGIAEICDIVAHIKKYLSLGLYDSICLGCDFDGISSKPRGIDNVADLSKLEKVLSEEGISEDIAEKIFFRNAMNFVLENLK